LFYRNRCGVLANSHILNQRQPFTRVFKALVRVCRTYTHHSRQRVHNLMRPDVRIGIDILPVRIMSQSFLHLPAPMLSTRFRRVRGRISPLTLCPDLPARGWPGWLRDGVGARSALEYSRWTDSGDVRDGHVRDLLREGDRSCSHGVKEV
jgi:hypothetical protein